MQVSRRLCPLFGVSALMETNKESILNGSLNVPLYQSDDKSQSTQKEVVFRAHSRFHESAWT